MPLTVCFPGNEPETASRAKGRTAPISRKAAWTPISPSTVSLDAGWPNVMDTSSIKKEERHRDSIPLLEQPRRLGVPDN